MENLRKVIYEFWNQELPETKKRQYNFDIIKNDLVNDIIGVRRCGKTYLMFCIIKEIKERKSVIYISFEDRRLYPLSQNSLDKIIRFIHEEELLKKFKKIYLFLDEIQNVPDWERFVRNIYDEYKTRIKIFVSGSNATLLSEDYGKLLTGRHISITLLPLSFPEFLHFNDFEYKKETPYIEEKRGLLVKLFREYLEHGGFPEVVLGKNKEELLRQYYSDIVIRDVTAREKLRKKRSVIEAIAKYAITNITSPISIRKVTSFLNSTGIKISVPTVKYYLRLLEDSFLIFSLPIHSYKIKDQLQYPQKFYCIDNGLRNAISFRFSEDIGKLYENLMALELKRRGKEVYYWKDYQHREVDFVVKEGLAVHELIQVCYNLQDPTVKKRELRALKKAGEELRCSNFTVLTEDFEGYERIKFLEDEVDIKFMPLWKWLCL